MSVSAVLQIAVPSFYPFTETCKCQFHIFAKPAPEDILLAVRMTQAVSRHPLNILAVYNRASNEGSRRFNNHREDPYCYWGLLLVESEEPSFMTIAFIAFLLLDFTSTYSGLMSV